MRKYVLPAVCAAFLATGVILPAYGDVVAARTLRIGTVLVETDLELSDEASATARDGMIGKETKRAIYAGRQIAAEDLGPVTVVRRNDVIRVALFVERTRAEDGRDGRWMPAESVRSSR